MSKPSPTLYGKIEQANKWFANPYLDDNGLGHQAAVSVIDEARKIMQQQQQQQSKSGTDDEFAQVIFESEMLLNQFVSVLCSKGEVRRRSEQVNELSIVGKNCQDKFHNLGYKITKALIQQVADDFLDIHHPLRKLVDVVMSPQGLLLLFFVFCFC